ncbi:JBTS26 [Mytilus coruscus]|uniref:JBTS26 n=2 Tax=Mytilus coruscus TaxID=42192 RepID=A0A6J8B8U9_MYTCO|nr:JBTS26 [Mytilus coruscus]
MSLGPGWWFSKPSTPRAIPTPRTPRATPTFQTQRGTPTFQIPKGTPASQTPRRNLVTQHETGSKYAVTQQRGPDHLPGLVEKPAQQQILIPQQSVVSPRKRKTWQTSEAESSYPRLNRQDVVSKLHRYSDSKINYLGNQDTRTLTPSDFVQRSSKPVSLCSNQNVSLSYSRRKQWDNNKNVKLRLASEYDQKDLTASEASHVDTFIVASVHFSGHPPPQPKYSNPQSFSGHPPSQPKYSNPQSFSGHPPPQPEYSNPQSFSGHPPPQPKYSQPQYFYPQVFANKNPKNHIDSKFSNQPLIYPQSVRYPGTSENRIIYDNCKDSKYNNPVYPKHLHMDQFSHHQKKMDFLPQIQTNYNTTSDVILNVSPRRRNWSSPITYYDNPTVFWVNMGSESDESKLPGRHKGSRTPRKSKRMAAKLDGHSSTETDSKQVSDSADGRRSPLVQKEEMVSSQSDLPSEPVHEPTTQYSAPPQFIKDPPSDHMSPLDPPSQHSTLSQSEDDIPMIQKLQQLNHKQQPDPSKKKGPPSWLKNEDLSGPFEGPPSSRQGTPVNQAPVKNDDHMYQTKQDDIDMLIDEELAMWPKTGKSELKTVFDAEKAKPEPSKDDGKATPMQKIKENRSKWRENQKKNLEESWGSLTMFDRQQKGRISMDLDDDSLDEYLNPSKKQIPKEAPIQEEDDDLVDSILNEVPGDEDFIIPELPYGKSLVIDIISTWGDRHYVGLTGIQLFTSTGDAVTVSKISAEPSDINILDEYNKDPRVISNVLDGVNRTRDDVHMWLAPFTEGKHNYINLTFDKPCKIALMRIWNYNKSRIHSYRGAKDVIITLDKSEIFKGEIERACGGIEGGTEAFGDTILFTTDENILESVSRNDDAYEGEMFDSDEPDDVPFERPRTADAGDENRPFTRAVGNIDGSTSPLPPRPATSMVTEGDVIVFKGKKLLLSFTATWGDMHYLGLTGVRGCG